MKQTSYQDEQGRWWAVQLPDDVPDSDASMGLRLGPPSLAPLELPLETEVRLHNQLFARRIFTVTEANANRLDIFAALQAAFRVDTDSVVQLYNAPSKPSANGTEPSKSKTKARR